MELKKKEEEEEQIKVLLRSNVSPHFFRHHLFCVGGPILSPIPSLFTFLKPCGAHSRHLGRLGEVSCAALVSDSTISLDYLLPHNTAIVKMLNNDPTYFLLNRNVTADIF